MAKAPAEDAFYQFAKELLAMAVAPHRYDNDPVHGKVLEEQQKLAGQYVAKGEKRTELDLLEVFEQQKMSEKPNIIQNVANKNQWKENPPNPELARNIGANTWDSESIDTEQYHAGRTIPSKDIVAVDRSDRAGEDVEMVTRTNIKAENTGVDEEILEILENEELHQKKAKKDAWDSTVSDVLDLLGDED